jgi:leader peptidase (prepilin peptidase)/N-methyltransferase
LTGITFLGCWLKFGNTSALLALACCLFLAGLIVATFIDFEHFIIPDEITIGGMFVGAICSFFVPALHGETAPGPGLKESIIGIIVGAGLVYAILRGGKLAFGREKIQLPSACKVIFTETGLILPDREIPYEDIFYRDSDTIKLKASRAELSDRCYHEVAIALSPSRLNIGAEEFNPEEVPYLEVTTENLSLPREAMGLGDVKFMAAIGAFLGWQAVIFSLFLSSIIGATVGMVLIAMKQKSLQSRLPYGPYIALAAAIWIFGGYHLWALVWATK